MRGDSLRPKGRRQVTRPGIKRFAQTVRADQASYIEFDEGLSVISQHARNVLGYDAIVLLLDELVLWLAGFIADSNRIHEQVQKVSKLTESAAGPRPAPIVSFVPRQRDLRDAARMPAQAWEILLDTHGERGSREAFRLTYPFSPAFTHAMVDISGALQRQRTALKLMQQLLVDYRDTLGVGQLMPLGAIFDVLAQGADRPFTDKLRDEFESAKKFYSLRVRPAILQKNSLTEDQARALGPRHPFRADDLIVKTLLLAALVPNVPALNGLTATRLAALNHGSIVSMVRNAERAQGHVRRDPPRPRAHQEGQPLDRRGAARRPARRRLAPPAGNRAQPDDRPELAGRHPPRRRGRRRFPGGRCRLAAVDHRPRGRRDLPAPAGGRAGRSRLLAHGDHGRRRRRGLRDGRDRQDPGRCPVRTRRRRSLWRVGW